MRILGREWAEVKWIIVEGLSLGMGICILISLFLACVNFLMGPHRILIVKEFPW